jgi:hypothetical protein
VKLPLLTYHVMIHMNKFFGEFCKLMLGLPNTSQVIWLFKESFFLIVCFCNMVSSCLSLGFLKQFCVYAILWVFCKVDVIWHSSYSISKVFSLNQTLKSSTFILVIINTICNDYHTIFKWHHVNTSIVICNFHFDLTTFFWFY